MPGYETNRFINLSENDKAEFTCCICQDIFCSPLVAQCCQQSFCKDCITDWLKNNNTCPYDRKPMKLSLLSRPPRAMLYMLGKLEIHCDFKENGCKEILLLENLSQHIMKCRYNVEKLKKYLCEEEKKFSHWLSKWDRRLTVMEEVVNETRPGSKFVLDLVNRLLKIENEMELQTYSSNLDDQAQILLGKLDSGSDAALEITRYLERLTQHWDTILKRMKQLEETLYTLSQVECLTSSSETSFSDKREIYSSTSSKSKLTTLEKKRK